MSALHAEASQTALHTIMDLRRISNIFKGNSQWQLSLCCIMSTPWPSSGH